MTRPVATHSATKMLPSASKQASWGWTNLPFCHLRFVGADVEPAGVGFVLLNPLGIGAEVGDHLVVLVEQRGAGDKLGHDHHVAVDVDIRRPEETVERSAMLAVEREPLEAVELAIGDDDERFLAAAIDPDAVREFERAVYALRELARPSRRC